MGDIYNIFENGTLMNGGVNKNLIFGSQSYLGYITVFGFSTLMTWMTWILYINEINSTFIIWSVSLPIFRKQIVNVKMIAIMLNIFLAITIHTFIEHFYCFFLKTTQQLREEYDYMIYFFHNAYYKNDVWHDPK